MILKYVLLYKGSFVAFAVAYLDAVGLHWY